MRLDNTSFIAVQTGLLFSPQSILTELSSKGHTLHPDGAPGVVCAVSVDADEGRIYANADGRKDGGVDGF